MNGGTEVGRKRSGSEDKASKGRMQVSLLDDTVVAFDVEPKSKSELLYQKVNNHLNLEESEYFGLQYFDNEGNMCWLDPMKPISKHVKEPSKVTFKFRVMFYSPDPNSLMEYTKYLFTLQIRRDLLDGRLYCSEDTGALLASYIVQGELGDYDPLTHREGYLSGFQFVSNQTPDVEEKIIEYHKSHRGQNPSEADHNMLEVARQLDMYGVTLFPAKDSDDADLSLSVFSMGILVFQDQHRINMFSWGKIRKISFKKKKFVIKLHPEIINIQQGEATARCLRYVASVHIESCFALKEKQKTAQLPRRKSSLFTRGSKFRYSGRTQKQILEESRETYRPPIDQDRSNRSARLSKQNETSPLSSARNETSPLPASPTTPTTFSPFNSEGSQVPRYNSTPSKKSEMSEDEGSFLLGSDSRKTSEQQLESTLISNSDERSSRVSSCEEHKVIKICHQDTAEQTDEEGEIKAENVAETEAGLDELKQEETPRKTEFRSKSDSDREIEDQVNSIIEKISKEYEMGKSGWQYRLTVDTDDKSNEVIPEEQRNGLMNEDVNGNASEIDGEAKDTFQTTVKGLQKCLDELKNHCQELQLEVNVRKSKCEISKDTTPKPTHFDSDSGGSDNEDDNAFEEDLYLSPVLRSPASSFCGSKDEFFSEQRVILLSGNAYHIAREILLTERTYVKDLEVLTVSFRSIVSADNMIPEKLLKLLYDNIDPLYDFHCSLLAELEERLSSWETMESNDRVQRIGDIMQRNMRQIKLYTSYIQKHDQILIELENEAKRSKKFEKAYKEFELQKICYLPLNTFLLKPVQRLLYYKSILGRLSKEYHRDHPDLKDVKNAHEEVMTACKQINESTRNLENLHKMVELERDLIGIDDLVHPAREFIREGCLHKVCRKGPQPRMFFLFSDILLYTSQGVVSTNQFRVRSQIPLHTMKIEEGGVELHGLYAFTVHGEGSRSFVVAASSPEEKYKWMEDLQTSIAKAKEKTICRTCHSNKSEFVSQIGQELGIFCSSCRAEIERLGDLREDERKKYLNSQFPVPVNIRKQNQDQDSDDECIGSIERVSSLDRRHAHARTMSTRKVCWHRNTSISMKEYTLSVQNNISGELWRKFKNSSKWQKLWVVFTNFCLFFFKSYEDDAPLASLPLIGYSISKASEVDNIQEDYTFKLQFKTHVYFFRATNDYDFQRWIEVISSATKNASRARIFSRMASNDP